MRRAFSVSVYVVNDRDVLLIRHKRLGLWLPLGGEIEANETPLEAARREVKEESQLEIDFPVFKEAVEGTPPGFIGYEEHTVGAKGLHLNFGFVAISKSREIVGDGSFTKHMWHPVSDILVYETTRSVHQCIDQVHKLHFQGRLK